MSARRRAFAACALVALALAGAPTPRPVRAASPIAESAPTAPTAASAPTAAPADSTRGGPLPFAMDNATITATRMLGQEDVGGMRHILLEVRLTQKGAVITAPRGYYYPAIDLTTLGGGARMVDSTLTIVADSASYARPTETLTGLGYLSVRDRDVQLFGDRGVYERRTERVTIDGRVSGAQPKRSFAGDRMVYDRRAGLVVITGNAVVIDSTHDSVIRGRRIHYDTKTRLATAFDRPSLAWTQGGDTLAVEGDRMRFLEEGNRLEVAGAVIARQGRQTVTGDSALFLDREAVGYVFGSPRVTDAEGELTGDELTLRFTDDTIDRAVMRGNGRVVYVPTDPELIGERSVVTGDSLTIFFREQRISRLEAVGHPTTEYRPSRADSAQGTGSVAASADTVTVALKSQSVDRVTLSGGATGNYVYQPRASRDSLDTVDYKAGRIVFHLPERRIYLTGDASTDYHELTLKAERIEFDAKKEVLTAEPKPILIDRSRGEGGEVTGRRIAYDMRSQRGTIYHGYTKYDNGYLFADSLRKINDRELAAADGSYTTCDLAGRDENPHFHFTSRKMKVYLGDKVVAKPVALYLGKIPIFALPFYVFSIRKGRHSGLLLPRFEFGFGSGGRFFENLGYYWAASDYTDYTFRLGYREKPGVLIGEGTAVYVVRGKVDGQVDLGHAWGEARGLNQVRVRHNQTFSPDFTLTGSGEFADPEYSRLRGLSAGIGSRVDRQLRSDFGLTRNWRGAGISMNLRVSQTKALDADLNDGFDDLVLDRTLPSLSASMTPRRVGRRATTDEPGRWPWAADLTYSLSFDGTRRETEQERTTRFAATDSTPGDTTAVIQRSKEETGRWTLGLRDSRKLLGWFNISPSMTVTENWVDREYSASDTLKGFRRAAVYRFGVTGSTNLYGTLNRGIGPIRALRHTLSPSVTFNYNPEFKNLTFTNAAGQRVNRFPGVGAVQSQRLDYRVENRFQAKVQSGADIKRLDLFSWSFSGSYDLLAARKKEPRPASNISNTININQIKSVGLDFNSQNDPYHQLRFQSYSLNSRVAFRGTLPGDPLDTINRPAARTTLIDPAAEGLEGFDKGPSLYSPTGGRPGGAAAGNALNWSLSFGLSYSGSRVADGSINGRAQVTSNSSLTLSRNWNMSYASLYSFETKQFTYQRVELHRDLHCWEAVFSYSTTQQNNEFYFRISVKDLPDIKFEQGPGLGAAGVLGGFAPSGF